MQPRYFIAIALPDYLSLKISEAQRELFQPGHVMEPLAPHITLLHPSTLQTLAPSHFVPKVKGASTEFLPMNIKLTATAMFDKRVLHVAVESPELFMLQQKLVGLLPKSIQSQFLVGRPFTPHITIAQAKPKQKLPDELIESFRKRIDPLLPCEFTASSLAKFTWQRPRTYKVDQI